MNNEVLNAIKTRRSIRKYKAEQITDEQLDAILEDGDWSLPKRFASSTASLMATPTGTSSSNFIS